MDINAFSVINETWGGEIHKTFFCVLQIPQRKLVNAIGSYAYQATKKDEAALLLYDSTVFGSAKAGFLLTSYGVYSKEIPFDGNFCPLDEIIDVRYEAGLLLHYIYLITPNGEIPLSVDIAKSNLEDQVLFIIFKSMLDIMSNVGIDENIDIVDSAESLLVAIDPYDEILKYNDLMEKGIITEEEFSAKKKQLLNLD